MNQSSPVPATTEFKDRRAGLIGFGILIIIIGCVCALFRAVDDPRPSDVRQGDRRGFRSSHDVFRRVMTYSALAVVFIWLGIGSTMARRWARALLLILAWAWLVMCVFMEFVLAVCPAEGFRSYAIWRQPMQRLHRPWR